MPPVVGRNRREPAGQALLGTCFSGSTTSPKLEPTRRPCSDESFTTHPKQRVPHSFYNSAALRTQAHSSACNFRRRRFLPFHSIFSFSALVVLDAPRPSRVQPPTKRTPSLPIMDGMSMPMLQPSKLVRRRRPWRARRRWAAACRACHPSSTSASETRSSHLS